MFREPSWNDHCAECAAEHVRQSTGRDVWSELGCAGPPRGWREAADLYRRHGVSSLADLVTVVLGPSTDRRLAMRGDIVMVDGALGICRGELVEFIDRILPLSRASRAWRVVPAA
jgi:hypothetical protein